MSDMDFDRPEKAVLYSEKLLGLEGDCNIPYCPQRERSTGWLLYDLEAGSWFIGFKCPDHGHSGAWRPQWQDLVYEVLEIKAKEGFDIAALQALRDQRNRRVAS